MKEDTQELLKEVKEAKLLICSLKTELEDIKSALRDNLLVKASDSVKKSENDPSLKLLYDLYKANMISTRVYNSLSRAGFRTVKDLSYVSREKVQSIGHIGTAALEEIECLISSYGFIFPYYDHSDIGYPPVYRGDTVVATMDIPDENVKKGDLLTVIEASDYLTKVMPTFICKVYDTSKVLDTSLSLSQIEKV